MVIFSFGLYQLSVAKKIFLTSSVLTAGGQNFKIRKIRRSHTLILPQRASKYMLAQYKWQKWIPDVKKHTFEKKVCPNRSIGCETGFSLPSGLSDTFPDTKDTILYLGPQNSIDQLERSITIISVN